MNGELLAVLQELDPAAAFTWLAVSQDLAGPLRIGVVSLDTALRDRTIHRMRSQRSDVQWVPLTLPDDPEEIEPGVRARSLGLHALIWAIPASQPWTERDRVAWEIAAQWPRPNRTVVLLDEWELVERMSDDPVAESKAIMKRVHTRIDGDSTVLHERELEAWLRVTVDRGGELRSERRKHVARALLERTHQRLQQRHQRSQEQWSKLQDALAAEDAELLKAQQQGQRAAGLLLATLKRQTESLMLDLGAFLVDLEHRLREEVDAVQDADLAQRMLPHWLQTVVERWTRDRLARWRLEVAEEMQSLPLTDDDIRSVALVPPYLHPGPMRFPQDWTSKIGTTASLGGATVLLAMGLWLPGIVAAGGGLLWAQVRQSRSADDRTDSLIETGKMKLRAMHDESRQALQDQVDSLDASLRSLGQRRADTLRQQRAHARQALHNQAEQQQQNTARYAASLGILQTQLAEAGGMP